MSVTVEHVAAVTRKCDACGKEEMRTVLGTDPEFAGISWEGPWKQFTVRAWTLPRPDADFDVCSKECYESLVVQQWDKL